MALSGLVAGGVQAALDDVLERRLKEQLRQQQEQQQAAQLALQQQAQQAQQANQRRTIDLAELRRRDDNNRQGLELMQADKAQMDTDAIMGSLPPRLKQIAQLRKVGVSGISPQDLQSPEETAAAQRAAKEAEFTEWKRKQDYDESQLRSRPKEPKPSGPGGLSPAQGNTALKFQDDYARDSKPYLVMRDAYQRVQSAAAKPDAAGDLSMIFAYMKLLDPNSVVREQEFANAQNAAGVPDKIRNTYNQIMQGNRLNPVQREQFVAQAEGLFNNARKNQTKVRQTYANRAKQWDIPETMVLDEDDASPQADAGGFSVKAPNGKTYTFRSAAELAAFKAKAGIP